MATDFEAHQWDPDAALISLTVEADELDEGDVTATAERLLRHALPGATASLVNMALYGTNERLRLDACKEVLNRCLGTVNAIDPLARAKDPLERLMDELMSNDPTPK
jgi:hypothetical protein